MAQAGVQYPRSPREVWSGGLELFAAVMMIIIGLFHIVIGLAAVLQSSFYVMVFSYNITAWAWLHLILGLLVALTGLALVARQSWARLVGIILVGLSALGNFLFMPYQPVWSLLIIVIDVAVIWALAVRQRELPPVAETGPQHSAEESGTGT